jgi:general stress protein CsbA
MNSDDAVSLCYPGDIVRLVTRVLRKKHLGTVVSVPMLWAGASSGYPVFYVEILWEDGKHGVSLCHELDMVMCAA